VAQLQTIYVNKNDSQEFQRKVGIKYCVCGKECLDTSDVCECGKNVFMSFENPESSEIIGGYIDLSKKGELRSFYKRNNKESVIKMNKKRIIQQLLLHKNKIFVKKEIIDRIYNANI
jgi:hypothetical protein